MHSHPLQEGSAALLLELRGRVFLLTGAASGIGAALARRLAAEGALLALVDVHAAGLERVRSEVEAQGCVCRTYVLDVSDSAGVSALPSVIASELGAVSVLINNAGVALKGRFEQVSAAQFERVMRINFDATVNMTRAFLPQLRASAPAQIVTMSSVFGLVGVSGQAAYCASKFAVRGFSEALRLELATSRVGVTVVHPGGVRTNIAESSDVGADVTTAEAASMQQTADKLLRGSPDRVAKRIVHAIKYRRKRVVVGADAHLLALLQRFFPATYGVFFPKG